jgi:hypothetical protein
MKDHWKIAKVLKAIATRLIFQPLIWFNEEFLYLFKRYDIRPLYVCIIGDQFDFSGCSDEIFLYLILEFLGEDWKDVECLGFAVLSRHFWSFLCSKLILVSTERVK